MNARVYTTHVSVCSKILYVLAVVRGFKRLSFPFGNIGHCMVSTVFSFYVKIMRVEFVELVGIR